MSNSPSPPDDTNGAGSSLEPPMSQSHWPSQSQASRKQRPTSVKWAVWLMVLGALVTLVDYGSPLVRPEKMKSQIRESLTGTTTGATDQAVQSGFIVSITTIIIIGVIGILLWLWMAWKNSQGRRWARVVAIVLTGINIVLTVTSSVTPNLQTGQTNTGVATALSYVMIAIGIVVVILLFTPASRRHFRHV